MTSDSSSAVVGGPSGAPHRVPRTAQDLHDRSHAFLSSVGPTLDLIETQLRAWEQLRAQPIQSDGLPANSAFRGVTMDPFTVQRPPPVVTEAEVTDYIKKMPKKDLKALYTEYELSVEDGFDYMHSDNDVAETTPGAAARIVHFVTEAADAAEHAANHETCDSESAAEAVTAPPAVSRTTRARELFEQDGASVDRLHVLAGNRVTEVAPVGAAAREGGASQTPPAFSLEQMTPSAVAAHERRGSTPSDSSELSYGRRSPTHNERPLKESYTVEIEYTADHFIPSSAQQALRDRAGGSIMVTTAAAGGHKASAKPPLGAHVTLDSDGEVDGDGEEVQSFSTFSRMVLANEGRRLTSQRQKLQAPVGFVSSQPADDSTPSAAPADSAEPLLPPPPVHHAAPVAATSPDVSAHDTAVAATTTGASAAVTSSAAPTASKTVTVKVVKNADKTSGRDAFVRCRVRDVLLANRVRAIDTAELSVAFFAKLDGARTAAAQETTPVLRKLDDLLCEASALLHTLEVMDHEAYRHRVMDPTQYLCVPRFSVACAAADCHTPFSTTVTRVMCGRCGQPFCPKCCTERGIGPDAVCDGQHYSLGWEPLCRVCFLMCYESQRRIVEERSQYLRIGDAPTRHTAGANGESGRGSSNNNNGFRDSEDDGDGDGAPSRATADNLTLKQAVVFGAYCDEQRCLSDGLPPFYVMSRDANEGVAFLDILGYQFAKTQGTLRRGWQNAGNLAAQAMQSASQLVSKRRAVPR